MTDEKDPKKVDDDEEAESGGTGGAKPPVEGRAKGEPSRGEEEQRSDEGASSPRSEEKKDKPKKKKEKDLAAAYRLASNHPVANAWKTFAGMGLIGIVGAGIGYMQDPTRFAYSWLFGFICALTLAVGAMMFVMMHHLTNGNWGIVVRRVAEIFGATSWVLIILVIPVMLTRQTLFGEWLKPGGTPAATHAALEPADQDPYELELAVNDLQPRGPNPNPHMPNPRMQNPHGPNPQGGGGFRLPPTSPGGARPPQQVPGAHAPVITHSADERAEHVEHEEVMKSKSWYLNPTFFMGRLIAYFIIWYLIGWTLLKWSTDQDKTKDLALTVRLNRFSAPGIVLLVLTFTFAAFDWIMTLDPTWYSTIFGVTFFAGSMVCVFAALILTFLGMRNAGVLVKEVTVEHYHDLGKLLFGFMCFWAYVCFSQFMLIWYAGIPEELTFYHHRWDVGIWKNVSLALVLLHFIVPFVFIMSRNVKRNLGLLRIGAWVLLSMHVIDIYWLVLPNVPHQSGFAPSWIDVFGFMGPVGVFLAVAFRRLNEYPIVPVGDPRLQRSLHFINA